MYVFFERNKILVEIFTTSSDDAVACAVENCAKKFVENNQKIWGESGVRTFGMRHF